MCVCEFELQLRRAYAVLWNSKHLTPICVSTLFIDCSFFIFVLFFCFSKLIQGIEVEGKGVRDESKIWRGIPEMSTFQYDLNVFHSLWINTANHIDIFRAN